MLTLTSPAVEKLNAMLTTSTDDAEAAIRMVRRNGRFRFCLDCVRRGDMSFAFEDRKVLVLDSSIAEAVSNRKLEIRKVDGKPRLRFARANP